MDAALGAVHPAALRAVAVIEHFRREAAQVRALFRLEDEGRDGGGILAEIDDQGLAGMEPHRLALCKILDFDDLPVVFLIRSLDVAPGIGRDGCKGEIRTEINLRARRRKDFAGELGVLLRRGEHAPVDVSRKFSRIVGLAVKDAGMQDRAGHPGLPVHGVRAVILLRPVAKREFHDAPESALPADHPRMFAGRHDLVRPPARRDLDGELVLRALSPDDGVGDVVRIGIFGLSGVGEAGFEHLFPDRAAVHIQLIDSEAGGHPFGGNDLRLVDQLREEPAGAVGGAEVPVGHDMVHDGGVRGGNPDGFLPGCIGEGFGAAAGGRRVVQAAGDGRKQEEKGNFFHIDDDVCSQM